jgi:hypothetical protein
MGNRFEHLGTEPLSELHHPPLMVRRAEVAAFARKGEQMFVTAIMALHLRKTKKQIATLKVSIDHVGDIGPPPENVARCVAVLPVHFQLLKMILNAAIITTDLSISGPLDADI